MIPNRCIHVSFCSELGDLTVCVRGTNLASLALIAADRKLTETIAKDKTVPVSAYGETMTVRPASKCPFSDFRLVSLTSVV